MAKKVQAPEAMINEAVLQEEPLWLGLMESEEVEEPVEEPAEEPSEELVDGTDTSELAELDSEPEPEPEPEPESEQESKDDGVNWKTRFNGTLQDLKSEREANKELRAKLDLALQQMERLIASKQEKPEPSEETIPDFDDDPTGNLQARLEAANRQIEELRRQTQQTTQATTAQQQMMALRMAIAQQEQSFAAQTPDYPQALAKIREVEKAKLIFAAQESGQQVNEQEIEALLYRNELIAAANLLRQGKNPAQYAYEMAKRFYGYSPAGAEQKSPVDRQAALAAARGAGTGGRPRQQAPTPSASMTIPEFEAALKEAFGPH